MLKETDSASRFAQTLGASPVRINILRFAIARRRVFASDVMSEFGLTRNGVRKHLLALSESGVLRETRVRRDNRRWAVCWTAERQSIIDVIDDLDVYLLTEANGQ